MDKQKRNRKPLALALTAALALALVMALPAIRPQAAGETTVAPVSQATTREQAQPAVATSDEEQEIAEDANDEDDSEAETDLNATVSSKTTLVDGREAESGVVLVKPAEGVTAEQLNARLRSLDYLASNQVDDDEVALGSVALRVADGVSVDEALARIAEEDDSVAQSQPNYVYHLLDANTAGSLHAEAPNLGGQGVSTNDPYIDKQWGLKAVKAFDAWESAKAEKAVTIAFIDSGIDIDHKDLMANVVNSASYWSSNPSGDDWYGHGTHTIGIASAVSNNAAGIAGVSYNANIMSVQALDDAGDATSQSTIWAFDYITNHAKDYNVRVINFSVGGRATGTDAAIDAAMARAHKKGLLIVCAAGNGGTSDWFYPVDFDPDAVGVISVEQSGTSYKRSSFSNYNDKTLRTKDLSAPGTSIFSTTSDGRYGYDHGTSMATPFVSGIAALMFTVNPNLTAAQVKKLLCSSAVDLGAKGWDLDFGYGLVDANAAVAAAIEGTNAVKPKTSIAGAELALSKSTLAYAGKARKPAVTVKLGKKTLVRGTDYRVSYLNNTKPGDVSVLVIGIGSYSGTATTHFTIK